MHEHSLNGVLHVFAVLAARAGKSRPEASRLVEAYLTQSLGLRDFSLSLDLFGDLLDLYAEDPGADAAERGLDGLCSRLDALLSPADKQAFLLHALQFRSTLGGSDRLADALMDRVAAALRVPEAEWNAWLHWVAGTADSPDAPRCRRFHREGWRASAWILHSPWTDRLLLRAPEGALTLDDNPVEPGRFYLLEPGAILRDAGGQPAYLCDIERLFTPPATLPAPIRFEAQDIHFRFPGGIGGIHAFSCCETGGRLIGVMGGSGAGKSTLISLLNGSRPPDSGRVLVNGIDLYAQPGPLEGVIGHVPQDDLLLEDLTVRENLDYNARLCLAGLSPSRRAERVDAMLRELHQQDVAHLPVGNPLAKTISGGQRKRLNIALELIREPSVLFVDEPTSGLSSADSDIVMGLLKAQAARGCLVIVIIHQPSSALFRMFDALWILDQGGYPVYMGHPLEAIRHLRDTAHLAGADRSVCPECGNVMPEQILAVIETKDIDPDGRFSRQRKYPPEFWHAAWRRSSPPPSAAALDPPPAPPPQTLSRPFWPRQLAVFLSRTLRARLSNRAFRWVNLLEPPLLAVLTAGLCRGGASAYVFGDNPYLHVYFFMAVIVAIFLGLSISAEEIVRDRRILRRERFLHLSWSAYSGAKLLHITLLSLGQSAVFAGIGVGLLHIPGFFFRLWLVLFSSAVFGGFLGLNVSARFKSAVTVYILLPLLLLPQMLLGGLIIAFDDLHPRPPPHAHPPWIGELTASRWAFEALAVEQFQSNALQRHFLESDATLSRLDFAVTDWIPALIGRLDALYLDTASPEQRQAIRNLLIRELNALERKTGRPSGASAAASRLRPPDRSGVDDLKSALRVLARDLQAERRNVQRQRNAIHDAMLAMQGEDGMTRLVKTHANRALIDLVRNRRQLAPLREQAGRLIRLSDPVFQDPDSPWGRAPFMAGAKRIGPFRLRTFTFNVGVLWLMNAALAACLAFLPPHPRRTADI